MDELDVLAEVLEAAMVGTGRDAGERESSVGGGKSERPRPSRRHFLRAAISSRKAMFSDLEDPSSVRTASIIRSRSAISPSRVVIYSIKKKTSSCQGVSKLTRQTTDPFVGHGNSGH